MAKFRFRLSTLRKLRATHRDEMRGKLAEALQAKDILQRQLADLKIELHNLQTTRRKAFEGSASNVNQLLETQRYHSVLRAQETTMEAQVDLLVAEVQRRRQAVTESNREVLILDNLEKRQLEANKLKRQNSEIKEFDEIAARRKEATDTWA